MDRTFQIVAILILVAALIALGIATLGNFDTITSLFQSGFTDDQIRQVEQTIKEYYLKGLSTSPSAVERGEVASGSTTVEVTMIKVSAKRLEGFAKISSSDQESKELGFGEVTIPCEATLGVHSDQWIWKCQNK